MIIIMFDAHKLDISDELKTVLETLNGLFNDVTIEVTLPELPKELINNPANQFATKSMIEVVHIAMTRCLLL